jgi:hypothetical protein
MATTTTTTKADTPIATPPPNQNLTTPGGGYASSDPAIQAQIKAMQSQVVAQSKQQPGTLVKSTPTGSLPTGTGSVPVTYQAQTTLPDPNLAANAAKTAARPASGTAYNPESDTYIDPLAQATGMGGQFIGWGTGKYDPKTGQEIIQTTPLAGQPRGAGMRFSADMPKAIKPVILSPEQRSSLSNIGTSTGGVLTTDSMNQAKSDVNAAIVSFQAPEAQTPHDTNSNISYNQGVQDTLASTSETDPLRGVLQAVEDMRNTMKDSSPSRMSSWRADTPRRRLTSRNQRRIHTLSASRPTRKSRG